MFSNQHRSTLQFKWREDKSMLETVSVVIFLVLGLMGMGVNLYISMSILKHATERTIFDLGNIIVFTRFLWA